MHEFKRRVALFGCQFVQWSTGKPFQVPVYAHNKGGHREIDMIFTSETNVNFGADTLNFQYSLYDNITTANPQLPYSLGYIMK